MARFSASALLKKLFTRPTPRTRRPYLGAESLEARVVPAVTARVDVASRLLVVTGTPGSDNVYVSQDSAGVHVHSGTSLITALASAPLGISYNGSTTTGIDPTVLQHFGNGYGVYVNGMGGGDCIAVDFQSPIRAWLTGGAENDSLTGGGQADYLEGGGGTDYLTGGGGNDTIYAGAGDDSIYGGPGGDQVFADVGNDSVYGGDGNDLLYGGPGNDQMDGENGNDQLYGRAGNDTMYGRAGDDYLAGEDGNDSAYGNDGGDMLNAGPGNDTVYGGAGGDSMFGDTGSDYLYGEDGDDSVYGGPGDDSLSGDAGDDYLFGRAGNDYLFGRAGNDVLQGEDGRDWLYGEDGADTLYGGANDDYLHGGPGNDRFSGGSGTDTFRRNLYLPGFTLNSEEPYITPEYPWGRDNPLGEFGVDEDYPSLPPIEVSGSFLSAPCRGAKPSDVDQTGSPTCNILACLAAVSAKVDLESNIRYDAASDTYTIDLFVAGGSRAATAAKRAFTVTGDWTERRDPNGPLWVTLYQKAFLDATGVTSRGAMSELLPDAQWTAPNTDWRMSGRALYALTGVSTAYTATAGAAPQDLAAHLNNPYVRGVVASTLASGTTNGIVDRHVYRVVSCFQIFGAWFVQVQNPWGDDGVGASTDGSDDGLVILGWDTFKANFTGYTRAGW